MSLIKENPVDDIIYRDNIPQEVSRTIEYMLTSFIVTILLCISIKMVYKESLVESLIEVAIMTSVFFLILIVCGLLRRICNFLTEIQLIKSHYENQWSNIAAASFDFSTASVIVVILALIFSIIYTVNKGNPIDTTWARGPWSCLVTFVLAYFIYHVVDSKGTNYMTTQTIRSMAGVDYGSGMAFSYFYGYLRIVLPGIRKKMDIYEANEHVTIPVKKMFILIPKSGHIPPDLCDASDQWLEGTKNLEHEVIDRAGVKRRNYKNTVYKIHRGGIGNNSQRPVYITTEGATPMLTFWEILIHNHKQTATYRQNRMQIVHSFYKTLHELIDNDPECRDVCELIFYEDYDENRRKVNVAEILLKRLCTEVPSAC